MARDATYQLRLDESIKREAFAVFEQLGMTPAEGMRIFLQMVAKTKSIPFPVRVPNRKTVKALLAPSKEKGYKRFKSVDALFTDLNE